MGGKKYYLVLYYMDFKDFILKYTFINSKFLNDFYNIIKEDYIERFNEFLIDSELLRKWLAIKNRRVVAITSSKYF